MTAHTSCLCIVLIPCEFVRYESESTRVVCVASGIVRPLAFQHSQFLMSTTQFVLQMVNHFHHFSSTWVVVMAPTTAHVSHNERPYITDVSASNINRRSQVVRTKRPMMVVLQSAATVWQERNELSSEAANVSSLDPNIALS